MTSHAQHIAVVSMAGIFPGARDTRQFINNVLEKKQSVIQVPSHRWAAPVEKMVSPAPGPDRAVSDKAGLITDFVFDPRGLDMDPEILSCLDPVHHLVLDAGRTACRACLLPEDLKQRTGVILAAIALPTDTASAFSRDLLCAKKPTPATPVDALACNMVSAPAGILARALGLGAGSFTLDAACASSLVAVKLACEHLISGRADVMVTGGVSRPDSLYTQIGFTQLAALSPSGRCAPFDRQADGLVVGEGCGILVLKRLADALACKDRVWGIIKGWGTSNDIEGNLVAPASEGQVRAMTAAWDMAQMAPGRLQYMECHGSGTPKGDQVELTSIRALLEKHDSLNTPLAIGSVKSNIGHLLTAAGAAGIIKTLLAMNQKILPPSCNFTALPDRHPLDGTRVQVQTRAEAWSRHSPGEPRRAGISAFGFGGINAHLLVEEFEPSRSRHVISRTDTSLNATSREVPFQDPLPEDAVSRNLTVQPAISQNTESGSPGTEQGLSGFSRPGKTGGTAVALVGIDVFTGTCPDLAAVKNHMFNPAPAGPGTAAPRWRRTDHLPAPLQDIQAGFITDLTLAMDAFHIPPVQMPDILPQHLVLLTSAKRALSDAGIPARPGKDDPLRTRAGCAVGIEFDFGAADFTLRWQAHDLPDSLLDRLAPPLTFNRTLGALGGIAASRVAREFKLGGPCFTVSAGSASGIKALEVGIQSLAAGETDWFLCAAVDMAGDIRQFCLNQAADPFEPGLPAEGAAAVVIKRLADAKKDNDRIYAVIEGVSGSSGCRLTAEILQTDHSAEARDFQNQGHLDKDFTSDPQSVPVTDPSSDPAPGPVSEPASDPVSGLAPGPCSTACQAGLERLLADAGINFSDLSLLNTHSGGSGPLASMEIRSLAHFSPNDPNRSCSLGWTAGAIGDTRGASGLCSVIHTALCLYHRTIPGIRTGIRSQPWFDILTHQGFVIHETALPWPAPPGNSPRRAATIAMTHEGGTAFCLLAQSPDKDPILPGISAGRGRAIGRSKNPVFQSPQPGVSAGHPLDPDLGTMINIFTTRPAIDPDLMTALNPGPAPASSSNAPVPTPPVAASVPPPPEPPDPALRQPAPGTPPAGMPAAGGSQMDSFPAETGSADPADPSLTFGDPALTLAASRATAQAHERFLAFTRTSMDQMQAQFDALTRAAAAVIREDFEPFSGHGNNPQHPGTPLPPVHDRDRERFQAGHHISPQALEPAATRPLFTRDQCLEFAVGRAGNVLGPDFEVIDSYQVRVRLPDEPLMLVDRIMAIEGKPCSLGPGKIITQHDVLPGAWYLDGGAAPVSISIEAGQADLFLCAYLGIDHAVKGRRRYRLLDAKVTFHRPLPRPGETIEYHIRIDRFLKQGDVYLFFFHYKGCIGKQVLISMRDGCAGFFTEAEVENSGGIVLKKQDLVSAASLDASFEPADSDDLAAMDDPAATNAPENPVSPEASDLGAAAHSPKAPALPFTPLVPARPEAFTEAQVQQLRNGNLTAAFGSDFTGMTLGRPSACPAAGCT
jgi:acyl transferase domain-containing protein